MIRVFGARTVAWPIEHVGTGTAPAVRHARGHEETGEALGFLHTIVFPTMTIMTVAIVLEDVAVVVGRVQRGSQRIGEPLVDNELPPPAGMV